MLKNKAGRRLFVLGENAACNCWLFLLTAIAANIAKLLEPVFDIRTALSSVGESVCFNVSKSGSKFLTRRTGLASAPSMEAIL